MDGARQIRTDRSPNEGLHEANTSARAGGGDANVTFATMCLTQDKGVAIMLPQGLRKRH